MTTDNKVKTTTIPQQQNFLFTAALSFTIILHSLPINSVYRCSFFLTHCGTQNVTSLSVSVTVPFNDSSLPCRPYLVSCVYRNYFPLLHYKSWINISFILFYLHTKKKKRERKIFFKRYTSIEQPFKHFKNISCRKQIVTSSFIR